jgi:ABC-2 type transport system permease protein
MKERRMHTFGWLIRREFWENRAIWICPALLGIVLTFAVLFGRIDVVTTVWPERQRVLGPMVLLAYGATFFVVMGIYCSWYLLECLYADRKDRSVLFWKSLPITDSAIILSKLFTGAIAIPVVYFLAADISTVLMAFVVSLRAHAYFGSTLWRPEVWLQLQAMWLYVIVTCAVWYLPICGWLLLVSAWAKRAVVLWFILPPLGLYWAEWWFFGTRVFGSQLADRLLGYIQLAFFDQTHHEVWVTTVIGKETFVTPSSVWRLFNPIGFFSSPRTWIGAVVGAAFIYGATQLRLRRAEN